MKKLLIVTFVNIQKRTGSGYKKHRNDLLQRA